MAKRKAPNVRLRREMTAMHAMAAQISVILVFTFILVWLLSGIADLTYIVGGVIGLIGMCIIFLSISYSEDVGLAVGTVLEFSGAGVGVIFSLPLQNIVTVLIMSIFAPLALAQYQIGICLLAVEEYVDAEGTDYGPAVEDLEEHMEVKLRVVFALLLLSYLMAVLVLSVSILEAAAFAINSLIVTGVLMGVIITGAALLFMLKGGGMPKEEDEVVVPA